MNLRPSKIHANSVTLVMVPFDQYTAFPKAVRRVFKYTDHPFQLVVIEGCAPHSVRVELEKIKKKHKNMRIIYSDHRPRMAEAFNLAVPHIRTDLAFFMHNDVQVTPGWLGPLMAMARSPHWVICPDLDVIHKEKYLDPQAGYPATFPAMPTDPAASGLNMHAFLMHKDLLKQIESFDEKVGTALVGLELGEILKKIGAQVRRAPVHLLYEPPMLARSYDLALFARQWDEAHLRESLAYLRKKWHLDIPEKKYLNWLRHKKALCEKKPFFALPSLDKLSPFEMGTPKINLRKFLDVLNRA